MPKKRTWISSEPLPDQMRWKVSQKVEDGYVEVESNSLFTIFYMLFVLRSIKRKTQWDKKFNKWNEKLSK